MASWSEVVKPEARRCCAPTCACMHRDGDFCHAPPEFAFCPAWGDTTVASPSRDASKKSIEPEYYASFRTVEIIPSRRR